MAGIDNKLVDYAGAEALYNDLRDRIETNSASVSTLSTTVNGKYTKPVGGIPSTDLASGVLTSIIDDTAGAGDTNKVWSANKSASENSTLLSAINTKLDEPSTAGTAGQVLTSDGNGGQSWQTPDQGTVDYTDLENKPSINSVTLSGNKSLTDIGVHNVPSGGASGKILKKASASDFDLEWGDAPTATDAQVETFVDAWLDENITNPDSPPLDRSLFSSSAAAPADLVGNLKAVVDELPDIEESDETGVDLDVSDKNGNVLVRFKNGHISTKEFDSSTLASALNGKQNTLTFDSEPTASSTNPVTSGGVYTAIQSAGARFIQDSTKTGVDLDVSDQYGNVIMRIANGDIKTKNFDSSNINAVEWRNAVYCSHGDSITWQDGKAYIQGQHIGETARGYQTILKEKLGLASYDNYGKSGWSMAVVNSNGVVNTITGVASYSYYDLVTIACGTNDFKLNVPIGTLGQIGDTTFDDTKFYGAYRKAIEYILTSKPTIRLVLMTPLQRDNSGYDVNYTNSAGHKLIDYVDAVIALGKMYSLPVVDMYANSGFTKKTLSTYTMDGLHPNDVGYERMGGYLCKFITNVGK